MSAMTVPASQRPFYKRKRGIVAGVIWLLIAYPSSAWPIDYLYGRGAITRSSFVHDLIVFAYAPLRVVLHGPNGPRPVFVPYLRVNNYCMELGKRHAASE